MLAITLADLRMRFRQFLIAVVGAGLMFALALLLTGMVSGFHNEIDRTVAVRRRRRLGGAERHVRSVHVRPRHPRVHGRRARRRRRASTTPAAW